MVKLNFAVLKSKIRSELSQEFLRLKGDFPVIAKQMDRLVRLSQWPAAYTLAALSPLIFATMLFWLARSTKYPIYASMFWIGFAATLALTRSKWVSSKILKTAIRWERRITQSLFSLVLLQPTSTILRWVKTKLGIQKKMEMDSPGSTVWFADDNWLVRTSPYFLPTASILLWIVSIVFLPAFLRSFILGIGVAYHLLSVYIQLTSPVPNETNLSYPKRFLWLFLVPMNLLVFATGYAFALEGFSGLQQVFTDLLWPVTWARQLIQQSNS
ncbi:MAG: hypothetical protein RLZZ396_2705 [Planctomycetota bacterium]